jgi:hypothetical protein
MQVRRTKKDLTKEQLDAIKERKIEAEFESESELRSEDNFLSCKIVSVLFGKKIAKAYEDFYLKT